MAHFVIWFGAAICLRLELTRKSHDDLKSVDIDPKATDFVVCLSFAFRRSFFQMDGWRRHSEKHRFRPVLVD